ncbi:MAG: ankyrin repeat domain-containing protein, partial [Acetobacteraceae bacterium]|nr:ankyrin repeat domain-containing protein [Acetobacteraceae bacterium]
MIPRLLVALPLLAPLALPLPAAAQMSGMGMGMGTSGPGGALGRPLRPQEDTRPREAPPALPGIAGRRQTGVIPPEVNPLSLNPNDALFDGIARGDMGTIRDAINRGADVNARNRLGLTALDAAVDQGRPEITFYLLSVRGVAANPTAPDQPEPPRAGRPVREPPAA